MVAAGQQNCQDRQIGEKTMEQLSIYDIAEALRTSKRMMSFYKHRNYPDWINFQLDRQQKQISNMFYTNFALIGARKKIYSE